MLSVALLAFSAFLLAFIFTPVCRRFAVARGWMDLPDKDRKRHPVPVPRIGGVPIVLAYAGAFAFVVLMGIPGVAANEMSSPSALKLVPAAVVIFLTGLIDDIYGMPAGRKLIGQILAAVLACLGGIQITALVSFPLGDVVGPIVTVVWLVACSNAFNLIDGVDGLASGLGFLATVTVLVAGLLYGDWGLVVATAPLAGALLGFLLFNFNPASIFLGDAGSLWVGFMLGCYGVIWSQKSATLLGLIAPMMALCVPLLDTALSILRRFLRRQPIFSADHGHIHHRLLDRGLTPRRVALMLYAASGVAACLSILYSTERGSSTGLAIVLFCLSIGVGVYYLGYQEFNIAVRAFRQISIRNRVWSQISMRSYEDSINRAGSVEDCWDIVTKACRELGFSRVEFQCGQQRFQEDMTVTDGPQWTVRVPLSGSEYVQLSCLYSSPSAADSAVPLLQLFNRALTEKTSQLAADRLRASTPSVGAGRDIRERIRERNVHAATT